MLRRPQHPWTLVELSKQAHMSRANFARVFRQVTQQTPLQALPPSACSWRPGCWRARRCR
ncbi:AraC family transcriptional regulator [Serratia ureilytica]